MKQILRFSQNDNVDKLILTGACTPQNDIYNCQILKLNYVKSIENVLNKTIISTKLD